MAVEIAAFFVVAARQTGFAPEVGPVAALALTLVLMSLSYLVACVAMVAMFFVLTRVAKQWAAPTPILTLLAAAVFCTAFAVFDLVVLGGVSRKAWVAPVFAALPALVVATSISRSELSRTLGS